MDADSLVHLAHPAYSIGRVSWCIEQYPGAIEAMLEGGHGWCCWTGPTGSATDEMLMNAVLQELSRHGSADRLE